MIYFEQPYGKYLVFNITLRGKIGKIQNIKIYARGVSRKSNLDYTGNT
jgi:hypothetical protein